MKKVINVLPVIIDPFRSYHAYKKERALYEQLYKYCTTNNLFHNSQYGFRREHSTELVALELIYRVTLKMDEGKIPIAMFLDFF